jgi:hypothetical protein
LLFHYEAEGKSLLSWIITGDETRIYHLESYTKDSHQNGIIQLLERSLRLLLQLEKSWSLFTAFWAPQQVSLIDIMPCGQTTNSDPYIQTSKTLQKHFTRVQPHKNVARILLQHKSTTTNKFEKNRKQSQNSDGLFCTHHHTPQILLPQISTSLEPSKMPSVGKGLGVMTTLLKK